MPISFDARNKRWRYYFDRTAAGARQRASKLLPKGWSRAQAQEFDRIESARLYAVASGVTKSERLIDDAVLLYLEERGPHLKNLHNLRIQFAACLSAYTGRPMSDLAAVAREYAAEQAGVLAPGTIRNRIAYLRAACRYAWKHHGWGDEDPAARLAVPPANNARHVYLSRAEMLAICRKVPMHQRQARAAIRVAFYSGMRQAEICRAVVGEGVFGLGKTKNGLPRIVPVHRKVAHILTNKALWPIKTTTWSLSKMFKAAAVAAGLGHARFHDLRHATASEMVNAGVDLYTVGAVLGHKSAQSTQRYSHLRQDTLRQAMSAIGGRKSSHKVSAS